MSNSGERSRLEPGARLDRYELLCPIAHGGMASVWLARLQGLHGFEKLVAVKTILPEHALDPRFQEMFLDEARIAARIEHGNVAQILDLGEHRNVLYLVMEWIDGDSLSKLQRAARKREQTIPMGIALRIVADVCAGLHAVHELRDPTDPSEVLGVVHRDVSPQNILISVGGVAKLIDFGIAKASTRPQGDNSNGLLKGKIQYMPPEQAVGQAVDRRADVWAIGAVLYYLLTGAPPYDGPNQLAILHVLTSGKPAAPLPDIYPRELDAICQGALVHDLAERTATAAELRRQIERFMSDVGLHATTSDVAAFMHEHVGERAELRRKAVEAALQASVERQRSRSQRLPPMRDPAPTPEAPSPLTTRELPHFGHLAPLPPEELPPETPHAQPLTELLPTSLWEGGPGKVAADFDPPSSQLTSSTLSGSSSPKGGGWPAFGFAPPASGAPDLSSRRHKTPWVAAVGVAGVAVFAGMFALPPLLSRLNAPAAGAQTPTDLQAPSIAERAAPPPESAAPSVAPVPIEPTPIVESPPAPGHAAANAGASLSSGTAPSGSAGAHGKRPAKRDYGF